MTVPAEKRVNRFDRGELAPPERQANGWLKAEGQISRIGVQIYEDGAGKVHRELRLPEDVFSPESIKSFQLVPLTNQHPPVLLDAHNTRHFAVGTVGESVRQAGDWLAAPLMITDTTAISDLEAGRSQLSCGYSCRLEIVSGEWRGEKYDAIQRDIRGNHLALVDIARAGDGAAVRLDADDAIVLPSIPERKPEKTPMPMQLRIDGFTLDATDGNGPAIQQAIERAIEKARADGLAKFDTEKKRADELDKRVKIVKANGLALISALALHRKRLDAMKARNVPCDECGGSGKVPSADDADKSQKCDFCDGKGTFRMHDAISAMTHTEPGEAGEGETPEMDVDADGDNDGDEEMDADELEVEQETETEAGKAHKDRKRADARKRRADERKRAAERWAAKEARKIDRAARARVALEVAARQVLGADAKLDGLDATAVKKLVVQKLAPEAKLDGKSPVAIAARYDAEMERLGEQPNAADAARGAGSPFVKVPAAAPRGDGKGGAQPRGRAAMLAQHAAVGKKA